MMTSTLSKECEVLNFKISYHNNRENRKPQKFKDNSQPPSSLNSCRISPLKHRLHPSANVAQAWHATWPLTIYMNDKGTRPTCCAYFLFVPTQKERPKGDQEFERKQSKQVD